MKDKAKAKVQEKALQPLGKVERATLEAVAKAKVKENPADRVKALEAVKVQVQVRERVVNPQQVVKAQARAVDRAKALEAVKVLAKAKDKAKALVKAKAVIPEMVDKGLHPANVKNVMVVVRIFPTLPKIVPIVMALVKHQKIILKTLWMIS